jgi:predicted small lipoprotein YifL
MTIQSRLDLATCKRGLSMTTMQRGLRLCVLLTTLCAALGGCGQKGDLYLPDKTDKLQDAVPR